MAYKEITDVLKEDGCFGESEKSEPFPIPGSDRYYVSHDSNNWEFTTFIPDGKNYWTRSKLDRLNCIEMLIKESLRLCSPPVILRYLHNDLDVGKSLRALSLNTQ